MRLAMYHGRDLAHLCVRETQTLRETMAAMSKAGLRLAPIISADGNRFVGVAADGDLRRYLGQGGDLDAAVALAANRNPIVLDQEMSAIEVRTLMQRRGIEYLPRVRDGRLEALYVLWAASGPQELTAVIMAGGLGSRLAPLTDNCPKPLLDLAGKPILTHIIEHLRNQGISRFVLSVNYLSDMIVDYYGDGSALDVTIEYVHETMRMGTGGALGLIDNAALSDPFMVLNGDILNNVDINALRDQHQLMSWDATMVVRDFHYTVPYGVVKTDEAGLFRGSEEKPQVAFHINAGIYMLSKSVLSVVPRNIFYDLPTLFHDLQERGMRAGTHTHEGRWIDIGNIAEYNRAQKIYEGTGN